jgi:CP family cyanate transporter-like MFS transporter
MSYLSEPSLRASARRRLYILTLGIILIGANLRAPVTAIGPLLSDIQSSLHLSNGQAGMLNALPLAIFALLSLVAPAVGRKIGIEKVLGLALAAIAIGIGLRSLPYSGALWVGTGLLSIGIAFGNVLLPGLVKRDFPHQTGRLIALYAAAMAGTAGLATGLAIPLAQLPGSDWRWATAGWLILPSITLLVWIPQMRGQQHHRGGTANNGSDVARRTSPWRHAIGWQVSIFFVLHSMVFYSIVGWFTSYAASAGISAATAGLYLLVYQVVAVATNLGCASLIKRFRDQTFLGLVCGVLLLTSTAGLTFAPRFSLIFLIIGGLGAGVAMVTSLSLFALRTHDHSQASALSGMAQFVGYIGAAAGPMVVGVLRDLTGSWTVPMSSLVIASALVIVFATLAGRARFIE